MIVNIDILLLVLLESFSCNQACINLVYMFQTSTLLGCGVLTALHLFLQSPLVTEAGEGICRSRSRFLAPVTCVCWGNIYSCILRLGFLTQNRSQKLQRCLTLCSSYVAFKPTRKSWQDCTVHESSLSVVHPGYQVLSEILFRLAVIANALTFFFQWAL